MIQVHSMKGEEMYVNPNMIESIRITPDTVLFLNTNKRIPVKDTPEELVARIIAYRQSVLTGRINPEALINVQADGDNNG